MKMKNQNIMKGIIFFASILVYTLSFVSAVNIGVSPATVHFDNVMRQGYAETYIAISADSETPINVTLEAEGNISTWLNFSHDPITLLKGDVQYVRVSVTPPRDTPNGNYTGFLTLSSKGSGENIQNHAVGKILSTLNLRILVSVTDTQYTGCVVKNVNVSSVEKGDDIILSMDVLNKGNVRLNPKVSFNVWDTDQTSVLKSENFVGDSIFPTREENLQFDISSADLDLGQYWGDLSVADCMYNSLLTFDVLALGALKSEGVLLNILSKKEAKVRETIPFEVGFKNTGQKDSKAVFKGKATYNGQIVQIFQSDELVVKQGTTENFLLYFTPQKPGKYVISGRVYYDGKRTYESSETINVTGSSFSVLPIVYGSFLVFIMILFFKIRRDKRVYREKLRRLK